MVSFVFDRGVHRAHRDHARSDGYILGRCILYSVLVGTTHIVDIIVAVASDVVALVDDDGRHPELLAGESSLTSFVGPFISPPFSSRPFLSFIPPGPRPSPPEN